MWRNEWTAPAGLREKINWKNSSWNLAFIDFSHVKDFEGYSECVSDDTNASFTRWKTPQSSLNKTIDFSKVLQKKNDETINAFYLKSLLEPETQAVNF